MKSCTQCIITSPVPWSGHLVRTSGALNPGVPALGATCCFLLRRKNRANQIKNLLKKKSYLNYHENHLKRRPSIDTAPTLSALSAHEYSRIIYTLVWHVCNYHMVLFINLLLLVLPGQTDVADAVGHIATAGKRQV